MPGLRPLAHNEKPAEVRVPQTCKIEGIQLCSRSWGHLPTGLGGPDWQLDPKTQVAPNLLSKHRLQSAGDVVVLVTH